MTKNHESTSNQTAITQEVVVDDRTTSQMPKVNDPNAPSPAQQAQAQAAHADNSAPTAQQSTPTDNNSLPPLADAQQSTPAANPTAGKPAGAPASRTATPTPPVATKDVEIKSPTQEDPENVVVVKVNPNDLLSVGEAVLKTIGHPAHHTELIRVATEMGLANDKISTINPRIWNDTRKAPPHKSKFVFYGSSVFGLTPECDPRFAQWPAPKADGSGGSDPKPWMPTRATGGGAPAGRGARTPTIQTVESVTAKIESLQKQLAEAEALKADMEANPDKYKKAPPAPAANTPPPLPSVQDAMNTVAPGEELEIADATA